MLYTDNPRKVYGKVKIIYSDSDISNVLNVETSGNGSISTPEQVYQGYISPTIKALTMDGNSTMGGGYQMNSTGLITGWWSDVHGDENGEFIIPPHLTITFIVRPIIHWTLIGDVKLGQYPVDFDVIAYNEDTIIDTKEIRGNTDNTVMLKYEEPLSDITSMKLVIHKWNKSNAKAKIIKFFDGLEEEYGGDDLKEFEVLEELSLEGYDYAINSDTASITIYNRNRKFDKGYLKPLLLLGRKVIPYLGVEKEEGIEYTKLGTFYTDEWSAPQSDHWVKIKCNDKMMRLQRLVYLGFPHTVNASLYAIAEDLLIKAGYQESQYYIDDELHNDIIDNGYMRKSSCWDALQEICYGGLCNAFIDRDDVLRITKNKVNVTDITIGADGILSYDRKTTMTDFSNCIEVPYNEIYLSTSYLTAYESVVTIDANSIINVSVDYSTDIADAFLSYLPSTGIELIAFESGVNAGKIELRNNNSAAITTTVKVEGYSIMVNANTVEVKDENSIKRWGKMDYKYYSSSLIQSYDRAYEIGELLLEKLNQDNGRLRLTWRGDPALRLQDKFIATDRFVDSDNFVVEYNRFKYDGGLRQDTRGR
jgi:hypothetical protein